MPIYGLCLSTLVHEFSGIYMRKLSNLLLNAKEIDFLTKDEEKEFKLEKKYAM